MKKGRRTDRKARGETSAIQTVFDLGVGEWLLVHQLDQRRHDGSEAQRKKAFERFEMWADPCGDVLVLAENALERLPFPDWSFALRDCGDMHMESIMHVLGKRCARYFMLGKLIWQVAQQPKCRGPIEDLWESLLELRLPEEVRAAADSWVSSQKAARESNPAEAMHFLRNIRNTIMEHLTASSPKVFISHSHLDIDLANELVAEFGSRGVGCFLAARDIPSGDPWTEDIRRALGTCCEVLVIVTPNSKDSAWVMIEVGAAWAARKTINIAYAYVELQELPRVLTESEAVNIETVKGRRRLVKEVSERLQPGLGQEGKEAQIPK